MKGSEWIGGIILSQPPFVNGIHSVGALVGLNVFF